MESRLPGFLFSIKIGGALENFRRPALWLGGKDFLSVDDLAGEHLLGVHGELPAPAVHRDAGAGLHLVGDDLLADEGLHRVLEEPAQGTGAVDG